MDGARQEIEPKMLLLGARSAAQLDELRVMGAGLRFDRKRMSPETVAELAFWHLTLGDAPSEKWTRFEAHLRFLSEPAGPPVAA